MRDRYLLKLAPLAELFYSYGIVSLITPCFTAPQTIGGLSTSDPLEPSVIKFWKDKVAEVVQLIPSFRGFLAKADSEGQPGPMKYLLCTTYVPHIYTFIVHTHVHLTHIICTRIAWGRYNRTEADGANLFGSALNPLPNMGVLAPHNLDVHRQNLENQSDWNSHWL